VPWPPTLRQNNADRVSAAASTYTNSSQWVRLSRKPSVDLPDDGEVPMQEHDTPHMSPRGSASLPLLEFQDTIAQPGPVLHDPPAPLAYTEFPADLFFNGIAQDASTWWNAFESFDPDGPSF
jgi:hypothetical protein